MSLPFGVLLLAVIVFVPLSLGNMEYGGDEMKRKQIAKQNSNNEDYFQEI